MIHRFKEIKELVSFFKKILTTKIIKKERYPYLNFGNNKNNTKVELHHVVKAVLYRLKTGCQWRELLMKEFFRVSYNWQSVYHHFRKWNQDGSWDKMWRALLDKYRYLLDMSCIQLDGTHTPAKRGGESVKYQGRKKLKTCNMLIIVVVQLPVVSLYQEIIMTVLI